MFDVDTVKKRLKSFGYEVKESDEFALTFVLKKYAILSRVKPIFQMYRKDWNIMQLIWLVVKFF